MPKDAKKQEFVNPLKMLTQLSPYANTEVLPSSDTEIPPETSVEANRETSPQIDKDLPTDVETSPKTITEANMSTHTPVVSSLQSPMEISLQTEMELPTQSAMSASEQVSEKIHLQTNVDTQTEVFTPVSPHPSVYVEDMWSHLPSDVVSKHATESNAMFERTHEKISSWLDKKLKKGMYEYFRINRRGGRKVTHILNEAVRDVLRKYQYLLPLTQELKRPIDDLLLEAMQDLVKKYQKKD